MGQRYLPYDGSWVENVCLRLQKFLVVGEWRRLHRVGDSKHLVDAAGRHVHIVVVHLVELQVLRSHLLGLQGIVDGRQNG